MSNGKIVFACKANGGRSVMAEAFARALVDPMEMEVVSAGSAPGPGVHPVVVEVMREVGIDVSSHRPRPLTQALAKGATVLVTMGCGEACPFIPGAKVMDWDLPDPKHMELGQARRVRDEVQARVRALVGELTRGGRPG